MNSNDIGRRICFLLNEVSVVCKIEWVANSRFLLMTLYLHKTKNCNECHIESVSIQFESPTSGRNSF